MYLFIGIQFLTLNIRYDTLRLLRPLRGPCFQIHEQQVELFLFLELYFIFIFLRKRMCYAFCNNWISCGYLGSFGSSLLSWRIMNKINLISKRGIEKVVFLSEKKIINLRISLEIWDRVRYANLSPFEALLKCWGILNYINGRKLKLHFF